MESITLEIPLGTDAVAFRMKRKAATFGLVDIDHWWMDVRVVTPKPGRGRDNHAAACDVYRRLATSVDHVRHLSDEAAETHLLARLYPYVRHMGVQKILAGGRVGGGRKANDGRVAVLDDLLRRDALRPITEDAFHAESKAILRTAETTGVHRRTYQDFCRRLFDGMPRLWLDRPEEAVAAVRDRWTAWTEGFARRAGRDDDKLVLDTLSYEAAAAWRQCYSACWSAVLLPTLHTYSLSRVSYRFLEYWHQHVRRERAGGVFDLFHGHVLGLHPAAALFVQTGPGQELLGEWLADAVPPPDLRAAEYPAWQATLPTRRPYRRLLRGLLLAVFAYVSDRDDANANRRGVAAGTVRLQDILEPESR